LIVFGDHVREVDAHHEARIVEAMLAVAAGDHDRLVSAFIAASELAQGIADAELAARGHDARSTTSDAMMRVLVTIAHAIDASWRGLPWSVDDVMLPALAGSVRVKRAEGFAYYAVYPEAYLASARTLAKSVDRVIGIRSIGTALAALVAAAAEAPLPATVRPRGAPFHRELAVGAELAAEWLPELRYAIADEGPGLSGSSFGAVCDVLETRGVPRSHVSVLPSHAGDLGPAASVRHRQRWQSVSRHVVTMDELLVASGRLERWLAEVVGPLVAPLVDISGGAWRTGDAATWPPAITMYERRKLRAEAETGTWLARFVGLGHAGEDALARARVLHAQGFTPQVVGLRYGFLVERWIGDAVTLDSTRIDRRMLVDGVGDYLAARSQLPARRGAGDHALIAMVRRNVTLGIDAQTAEAIVARLSPRVSRPVEIDGALHAWEWLVSRDGTLVKADAYDHCCAHDLIGPQDIAWDVAAAGVELDISAAELASYVAFDPRQAEFLRPCYLAFQLGRYTLAASACGAAEAPRLRAAAARYARMLAT